MNIYYKFFFFVWDLSLSIFIPARNFLLVQILQNASRGKGKNLCVHRCQQRMNWKLGEKNSLRRVKRIRPTLQSTWKLWHSLELYQMYNYRYTFYKHHMQRNLKTVFPLIPWTVGNLEKYLLSPITYPTKKSYLLSFNSNYICQSFA